MRSNQLALSKGGVAEWVKRGRLHPRYRGVYAYGHAQLSREGELMAAVLAAGDGAAVAELSAAWLLRVKKWFPQTIELVVPKQRRSQPGYHARCCRNLDPRDITVVNRIPVTTVARLLVDLTDEHDADELTSVIHEAAYLGKFSLPATRAAMERANGRHNLGVLEEALRLHASGSAGSRSRLEKRFKRLVRGAGLPEPRINTIVNGFEIDAYWPGVCVEVDGLGHRRPRTQAEDRIRDAALTAAGYTLLRFTEHDIDTDPARVLADLVAHVR